MASSIWLWPLALAAACLAARPATADPIADAPIDAALDAARDALDDIDDIDDIDATLLAIRRRGQSEADDAASLRFYDLMLDGAERHLGRDSAKAVEATAFRGVTLRSMGRHDAAVAALERAITGFDRHWMHPILVAGVWLDRGHLHHDRGERAAGLRALLRALDATREPGFAGDEMVLSLLDAVTTRAADASRLDVALTAMTDAWHVRESLDGPDAPTVTALGCRIESVRDGLGWPVSPEPIDCDRTLATARWGLGWAHPRVIAALNASASAAEDRGRVGEVLELRRAALDRTAAAPDGEPGDLVDALAAYGDALAAAGAPTHGRLALVDAHDLARALDPDDDAGRFDLVEKLVALDRTLGASRTARDRLRAIDPAGLPLTARFERAATLADLFHGLGEHERARAALAEARTHLDALGDDPHRGRRSTTLAAIASRIMPEHLGAFARQGVMAMERNSLEVMDPFVVATYAVSAHLDGRHTRGIFYLKRAIAAAQRLRQRVELPDERTRAEFHDRFAGLFRTLISTLVDKRGRLAEAQVIAELLREVRPSMLTRSGALPTVDVPLSSAERRWTRRYDAAAARYRAATDVDDAAIAAFAAELDAIEVEMDAAERTVGTRPAVDATDIQRRLGRLEQAALIQVIVGDRATDVIVTTADDQWTHRVEIRRSAMNRRAHALQRALRDRGPWRDPATALYVDLIAPIRARLDAQRVTTLLWALDGALRYVPMAVLLDPETGRHLVQDFAHARALDIDPDVAPRPIDAIAAFGATRGGAGLAPLPAVGLELGAIVRTGADDPTGALPGAIALDAAFTADRIAATLADPPPAVHIASHFVFRPGPPSASHLLLGDGSTLDLGILGAQRFDGIELLTLSACQTAVGSFAEGEPLDGFAALARRQGARAVLASLWPVVDDGTARLMAALYTRLAAGTPRAEALRGAQLEMLGGSGSTLGRDRGIALPSSSATGPRSSHPSVWAPFILIGDPR